MSQLQPIIEQLQSFTAQQVPTASMATIIPIAIAVMLGGVGLSLFGAKLAKSGIRAALGLGGAAIGVAFAKSTGYSQILCGLAGAAMFATIAFLTFRIWVGVATAAVFAVVVAGAFGYQNVMPHVQGFEQEVGSNWRASSLQPALTGEVNGQAGVPQGDPGLWFAQFRDYVQQRDGSIEKRGLNFMVLAMVIGLFLGVVAMRWMLILVTSVMGTAGVVFGAGTILTQVMPSSYKAIESNPTVMGMGVGGFIVTSLILQTLLTRKAPSKESDKPGKS